MNDAWYGVFGNAHPVEVEIGPGTGTFLLGAARGCPQTNFYGVEHSYKRAKRLEAAITTQALANVRVIAADASCMVTTVIPAESVDAYHIYFPDPWWKRRHHRRRLFTAPFAAALVRTLKPGGTLYLATDVDEVFTLALKTLAPCEGLSRDPHIRSQRTGVTVFERKGLARGATIHEATFVKRAEGTDRPAIYASNAAPITPAESPS